MINSNGTGFEITGKTSDSAIMLNNKAIKVLKRSSGINPLSVVTVVPNIQLQLGRTMKEFVECLRKVRYPIAVQKIASIDNQDTWYLIRMGTGNVPEARVCTINTLCGLIINVSFNQDLVYDVAYKKYQRLSIVHQLRVGKAGANNLLSNALSSVSVVTDEPISKFKIKSTENKIVVYTDIPNQVEQFSFTFAKDKNDYFNLLSLGYWVFDKSKIPKEEDDD